jgi:hypothetical protein
MAEKSVRDELAELTGAVRELRDREIADTVRELRAELAQLRAERAVHHCHGCSCVHMTWTYPVVPPPFTYPYVVTCENPVNVMTTNPVYGTATTSGTLTLNAAS